MKHALTAIAIILLIALISLLMVQFMGVASERFVAESGDQQVLVALVFTAFMFIATVAAPVAASPTIPLAAAVVHPAIIAALSVLAWTAGAVVAFLLSRHFGRPLLHRLVDMEKLHRYEERVPPGLDFFGLILLRILVPVDLLSYAIGLVSKMPLGRYTLATAIGVTPFSVIFAYGGAAILAADYRTLTVIVVAAIALIVGALWLSLWMYHTRAEQDE